MSIDPMADSYPHMTPYHYVLNNPMLFIDPTGMWTASYDSSGNIVTATYEEGDTYEDLYDQLGISEEDFAEFAAAQGIDISHGPAGNAFNITSYVFKNTNFSQDNKMMDCFSSCLTGVGAISMEMAVHGGFNFTEQVQELFEFQQSENSNTGIMTTWVDAEGITHHSAINVLKSQNGTMYYIGRPGPNSNISLQSSNRTNQLYPNFKTTSLIYPFSKPKF